MISRKTAIAIGTTVGFKFRTGLPHRMFDGDSFYDLLFGANLPAWLCNRAGRAGNGMAAKILIQRLHTGETVREGNHADTDEEAQLIGQQLLRDVAEALLNDWQENKAYHHRADREFVEQIATLARSLEIDGYLYRDGRLLAPDDAALDAGQEAGLLETLYTTLRLPNRDMFAKHLRDSEDRYQDAQWGDAISNARQFFETIMRESATTLHQQRNNAPLSQIIYDKPVRVREYLEDEGLVTHDEIMAIAHFYGLLSGSGNHPNMSERDQARLMRQLALTMGQFVLLCLEGAIGTQR